MIVYFTSTGNCEHAARTIAQALCDRAVPMKDAAEIRLSPGEKLGFVFPTYFWRLPSVAEEYMKRVTITPADAAPYVYFIASYGSTCGQTGTFMKRHLRRKGIVLSASFSVRTVDDWTVWFDLSDPEKVAGTLREEEIQIREIIRKIQSGATGNHMKNTLPMIAVMGSGFFYDLSRRTKHLHAEDGCIGCGLCARECPVQAISIENGRPRWVKDKCAMCLHCLHACPAFAIQYDDKTRNHGQYRHP